MNTADEHFERDGWLVSRPRNTYKIMVVEFNTGGANFIPVRQTAAQRPPAAKQDNSVSFDTTQAIRQSAKDPAPVRADKVAAATALANDPSYPTDAALSRLAGFLANRI